MIGSFITRAIIMAFGYLYPAYECYKAVEQRRTSLDQLKFWCQYWMILAFLTVLERVGDAFIDWLPMYNEAKLVFILYLWYPKTKGTSYIYYSFLQPFMERHELEIDRNLNDLKARAGDAFFQYWQRSSLLVQTKFFELLKFLASQSPSGKPAVNPNSQFSSAISPSLLPPPPPPPVHEPPLPYHHLAPPLPRQHEQQTMHVSSGYHPQPLAQHSPSLPTFPSAPPLYQMPPTVVQPQDRYTQEEEEEVENEDRIRHLNSLSVTPTSPPVPPPSVIPQPAKNGGPALPYTTRSKKRSVGGQQHQAEFAKYTTK